MLSTTEVDRSPDIEAALEFYESELPSSHVVDVELPRWRRKWFSTEDADLPTRAVHTLAACDREFFPNIHTLISILRTLQPRSHGLFPGLGAGL